MDTIFVSFGSAPGGRGRRQTPHAPGQGESTSMGVAPESFLDLQSQSIHAAPHVGSPDRQPHPYTRRHRNHRRSRASTSWDSTAISTPPSTITRRLFANTISMRPDPAGTKGRGSGTTTAGTKPLSAV